jgi:pilus assembly protein CpaC
MTTKAFYMLIAFCILARVTFAVAGETAPSGANNAAAVAAHAAREDSAQPRSVIDGPPLSLYHGEVQVLDLANVVRIAVGNGEVLNAKVIASDQVVLIGQSAGTTSMRVWTRSGTQFTYEVNVRSFDVAQILRDVQDLLADEPNLSARQVDGHVLIEGDYKASRAAARIAALVKIYPQIVSTVELHTPVQMDRMVYMDVRVVEIQKSAMRRLGVNWSQQASTGANMGVSLTGGNHTLSAAANIPRLPNGGYFGIAANLTSMLDLLEQSGESWTLAEPTVSCKSGGSAKFTVGGEIPVPVAAGLGTSTVIYKDYGVILEFKPVADGEGNVSSSIVAEVSQPDPTYSNVGNNGLVAFDKTRTETEVSLKANETLVISGLLKNNGNTAVNGIPGAKDIPVLGNLFKSKQFQNDRTELVVLVTPRTLDVGGEINTAAVHEANQMESHVAPTFNAINSKVAE